MAETHQLTSEIERTADDARRTISVVAPIKFGTDGWRAVIADGFTFDNVRRCESDELMVLKHDDLGRHGCLHLRQGSGKIWVQRGAR